MLPEDFDVVYVLWQSLPLDIASYEIEKEEILMTIKLNPTSCLVAEVEGKIVGAVIGAFNGRRGWINHLAIDEKFQKKGYGTKLFDACEQALKKVGARVIILSVEYKNLKALPFYLTRNYIPYHEALLLRKKMK